MLTIKSYLSTIWGYKRTKTDSKPAFCHHFMPKYLRNGYALSNNQNFRTIGLRPISQVLLFINTIEQTLRKSLDRQKKVYFSL